MDLNASGRGERDHVSSSPVPPGGGGAPVVGGAAGGGGSGDGGSGSSSSRRGERRGRRQDDSGDDTIEGRDHRRRRRDDDDSDEESEKAALQQVFKKAKVNEFDGVNKTGEDMEAWIEELEDYFALRKFSAEAKAKVAVVHLRSCAKLWWKAYIKQRTKITPITWEEFKTEAYKRYCCPHYEMDKKMDFYKCQQEPEGEPSLSVHEYKEKFLRLHKYAPEVEGEALKNKFVEGLRKDIPSKGYWSYSFLGCDCKSRELREEGEV